MSTIHVIFSLNSYRGLHQCFKDTQRLIIMLVNGTSAKFVFKVTAIIGGQIVK